MDKHAVLRIGRPALASGANGAKGPAQGAAWPARGGEGAPPVPNPPIEARKAEPTTQRTAAEREAVRCLSLVDGGLYDRSWSSAAAVFRQSFTRDEWARSVRAARRGHGGLDKRALQAIEREAALPGAPAGSYVLFISRCRVLRSRLCARWWRSWEAECGELLVAAYFLIG